MLVDLHNTVIKAPPSAIDSLKHSIVQLQVKVDSLQKISERAEIGKEFFSDTISTNLYMFATIIGLAALVSWGVIGGMLFLHKKKVEEEVKKDTTNKLTFVNNKLHGLERRLLQTIYDANRAMALAAHKEASPAQSASWDISAALALSNLGTKNHAAIIDWLESSLTSIESIEDGNDYIKSKLKIIKTDLKTINQNGNKDIKNLIKAIKKKINHITYTIPKPPEDLLDGPANTPPSPTESPTTT